MVRYFGFGSNMNIHSLRAKGVEPIRSRLAVLEGWSLRFNVQHFFRHEGGVGNIELSDKPDDRVWGVLHECTNDALQKLDEVEAYGYGYDRISVKVKTGGELVSALCYVGMPEFIDNSCLPSKRYLNIVIEGARQAGIDDSYIQNLKKLPMQMSDKYSNFIAPDGEYSEFTQETLAEYPLYTGLYGAVFDMAEARPLHEYLKLFFGGRDMTLFHLKRLDSSTGKETMENIRQGSLNDAQYTYINAYLNEYAREYRYIGRINYK